MLLSYLVTSRTRRELLRLMWVEGAEGSVSALGRQARVSFAAAHRELEAMGAEGLAVSKRVGAAVVYRANRKHSEAALVDHLLRAGGEQPGKQTSLDSQRVRGWLAAAGAPLLVEEPVARTPALEVVVAEGLALAHRDATTARVLPLLLWRQRHRLDYVRLVREATRRNERQTLGFFLELAGRLGRDSRLTSLSKELQDRRRRRARLFFAGPHGRMALATARSKTPRLARRWGYLMNMGLDSFASAFAKHRDHA